ncbi:MAG: hypothetical protein AAGF85_20395 [Bacteroidota bacterium]
MKLSYAVTVVLFMILLFNGTTERCLSEKEIEKTIINSISFDKTVFGRHTNDAELPIQLLRNKYSKYIKSEKQVNLISKSESQKLDGQFYQITKLKIHNCNLTITIFYEYENFGGDFVYQKINGELILVEKTLYEY